MIGNGTKINNLVLDASVAVKWFAEEENTSAAEVIFNEILERKITANAPDLILYEVGNSLWKGKKFEVERITASMNSLFVSGLQFWPLDEELSQTAIGLMVKYNLTFYDSVYAALAKILEVPLISANPKDHKKIKEIEVIEL